MKVYKLKSGTHVDQRGRQFATGEEVPSEMDLVKAFGTDKFELIEGKSAPDSQEDNGGNDTTDFGKDVTDKFPAAGDNDLQVFHDKENKRYSVVEDGEVVNTDVELTSQAKVKEYLDELFQDEE